MSYLGSISVLLFCRNKSFFENPRVVRDYFLVVLLVDADLDKAVALVELLGVDVGCLDV